MRKVYRKTAEREFDAGNKVVLYLSEPDGVSARVVMRLPDVKHGTFQEVVDSYAAVFGKPRFALP